jgi:ElaB/YqjD/DUF883 family membrane-anchored ribosome-binding protein
MEQSTNKNKFENLKDEASDLAKHAGEVIGDKYSQFQDKGKELAQDIGNQAYKFGEKTRSFIDDSEEKLKKGVSSYEEQVKSHPILATGAAMLLGALVAKFFSKN